MWRRSKPSFWVAVHWLAQQTKAGEDLTEFTDCETIGHIVENLSILKDCKAIMVLHMEGALPGSTGIVKCCLF